MTERVDVSRNASVYDRRHDALLPEVTARELVTAAALQPGARMLPGARSENEADDFLAGEGMRATGDVRIGPGPALTLAAFLDRIDTGECSYQR